MIFIDKVRSDNLPYVIPSVIRQAIKKNCTSFLDIRKIDWNSYGDRLNAGTCNRWVKVYNIYVYYKNGQSNQFQHIETENLRHCSYGFTN